MKTKYVLLINHNVTPSFSYQLGGIVFVVVFSCCVQLFATPWTVAHQVPLSVRFSRIVDWVAISSSRVSS